MAEPGTETSTTQDGAWRDRAVERSLRAARARAVSRNERYIQTAIAILSETGRTDFTLQELVERSKTSLRTFYQHFSTKDELLLALVEEVLESAVGQWRKKVDRLDPLAGLRLVVDKVHGRTLDTHYTGINRALSSFNIYLAETRPDDYGRVLVPLYELLHDVVVRGQADGVMRTDLGADELTSILTRSLVGSAQFNSLGKGRPAPSSDIFWKFLLAGVEAPAKPARKR